VNANDWRSTSTLLLVLGLVFLATGYAAAFTLLGAVLICLGFGMFAAGALLRTRMTPIAALLASIVMAALLAAGMIWTKP
jgi:Na+/phosphate symporter